VDAAELRQICDEVAALHEGVARERGVEMVVTGEARVTCDARKIHQVLMNLVQNALEVGPRGTAIEVRCEQAAARATVRVLDLGPGIDPSVEPRLFQPGATTKPNGTGVGLTFARALARQHGGELELLSRPGGGCEALLTLPLEPAPATPTEAPLLELSAP
jgi:signal transduction histidine kinase